MPLLYLIFLINCFSHPIGLSYNHSQINNGRSTVKFIFNHKVKDDILELNTKYFVNPNNEKYTVNVLKYYISNVKVLGKSEMDENNGFHLIDASKRNTQVFSFILNPGIYSGFSFLVGVDSLHNVSGAQSDDLDPLNGMFWSWNSGYIMAKLEGNSDLSKNNSKYEYHIGGFEGENNVLQTITLNFKTPVAVLQNDIIEIQIDADINLWWGNGNLSIQKNPLIAAPSKTAKLISRNYSKMFKISKVIKSSQ